MSDAATMLRLEQLLLLAETTLCAGALARSPAESRQAIESGHSYVVQAQREIDSLRPRAEDAMSAEIVELAHVRAGRGRGGSSRRDPRLGFAPPRRSAWRLVLGDLLGLIGLVLFIAEVFVLAHLVATAIGDPGHVEPDGHIVEAGHAH